MSNINERLLSDSSDTRLFSWTSNEELKEKWFKFLTEHKDNFKSYTGWFNIPRDSFTRLDSLIEFVYVADPNGTVISPVHKPFIFSLYVLLNQTTTVNGEYLSIEQIKELLGYNKQSNSIDYLIKENGLLDKYGVTKTATKGISNSNKATKVKKIKTKSLQREWKDKDYNYSSGNFVTLNTPVLLYILFNIKEIGVKGIYLYCYLLSKCIIVKGNYVSTMIKLDKMVSETGLNKSTVEKYINKLQQHNLVEVEPGILLTDEYGDIYKPDGDIIGKEVNKYKPILYLLRPE